MNDVVKQEAGSRDLVDRERQADTLRPPVDIFEEGNALQIIADMPGVTRDSLRVEVDNSVLTLEGEVSLDMPEGLSAIYAEVRSQRYARRFTLSQEIDRDAISATIDNGVVRLTLPKVETLRRRRIEVKSA